MMRRAIVAAIAFFATTAVPPPVVAGKPAGRTCAISAAHYAAAGAGTTARFRIVGARPGWAGDLALGVRSGPGRPEHWFLFDRGAARRINLISTGDVTRPGWQPPSPDGGKRPLGEMTYLAVNARMAAIVTLPESRMPAPHLLILPDLPEVLARRATPPEDASPILTFAGCQQ